jgi:hypothetical protein
MSGMHYAFGSLMFGWGSDRKDTHCEKHGQVSDVLYLEHGTPLCAQCIKDFFKQNFGCEVRDVGAQTEDKALSR